MQEIKKVVEHVLKFKPDLVITEKGLSDFAAHHLQKAGVSAIRRLRKTDNNRIARACGATIVNRPEDIKDSDIGTKAGLFEVQKIADEFWTCIVDCDAPQACTVLLRGASKDVLNEVERNLQDAMNVARSIALDNRLVAGGGAIEMAVSHALHVRFPLAFALCAADAMRRHCNEQVQSLPILHKTCRERWSAQTNEKRACAAGEGSVDERRGGATVQVCCHRPRDHPPHTDRQLRCVSRATFAREVAVSLCCE